MYVIKEEATMKTEEYLSKEEMEMIQDSIHAQVLNVKENLENKDKFKKKDEWEHLSFVMEGDDDS